MSYKALSIFSKLPKDVINICISYTGKVNYRFGKYINRIDKNDKRYEIIKKIQTNKKCFQYNDMYRIFINLNHFSLQYVLNMRINRIRYTFINNKIKYYKYYILDENNIWRNTVIYLM